MTERTRILFSAALVTVLGCSYAGPGSIAAADEIIVKFAADQAVTETVTRALDDTETEASLERFVAELSDELAFPLDYSRLTSGREIVVTVPAQRVLEAVADCIRRSDDAETVVVAQSTSGESQTSADAVLVSVTRVRTESGNDANALATRLVDDERYPVTGEFHADGRLAVTPDFQRLVGALAAELTKRSDIDYAQPNFRVRHYDKSQ